MPEIPEKAVEALTGIGVDALKATLYVEAAAPAIRKQERERIREGLLSDEALRAGWEAQDSEIGYGLSRFAVGLKAALATLEDTEEGR